MSILQAAILGIIQGLAEFIPISSSGHLELARRLMGLTENDAVMTLLTVLLHAGTLIAIVMTGPVLQESCRRFEALFARLFPKPAAA